MRALGALGALFAERDALIMSPMSCSEPAPLTFAFWPVYPEIVADNVRRFEAQCGERVKPHCIDGDYEPAVRAQLQSDQPYDLFYAQRGEAARWYRMGLIRPIDDLVGLDELVAAMSPAVVEDSRAPDGAFLGLTYYNGGPFCLFRNEKVLQAAGIGATENRDDYPRTWEEVCRQAMIIKRRGIVEHPLLMSWFDAPTGLPWNLIAQCYAEGEHFVDSDLEATFGPDTPLTKVLADWKAWWDQDLVPREVLFWQDSAVRQSWMQGRHAFHPTLDYHSASYSDARQSAIWQHNNMNPVMPGETGEPVLVGHPLLCMSSRARTQAELDRIWALMQYFGGKDKNGQFAVHGRWVREANFEVPFPSVYDEPRSLAAMMEWMYPPLAKQNYAWLLEARRKAVGATLMRAPWYHDWDNVLHEMIRTELLIKGTASPQEIASNLRSLWDRLHAQDRRR